MNIPEKALETEVTSVADSNNTENPQQLIVISAKTSDLFKKSLQGISIYDAKIGADWDLTKSTAQDFIRIIERKFANNNKFHGYFPGDSTHMAPEALRSYISKEVDFSGLVSRFMENVCRVANQPNRGSIATGHLVFVHYKSSSDEDEIGRFLAVLVGKQGGFDFDAELQPVGLTSINTNELRHAAMFDLTLFDETYPKNDGDSYLKFIAGKSKSAFLKEAFGCGDHIPNKDSIEQLNKALRDFLGETELPRTMRFAIIESVTEHIAKAAKRHASVTLDEIENVINGKLPVDSGYISRFKDFVNKNEYTISEIFEPTRASAATVRDVVINDPSDNFKCKINLGSICYISSEDGKPVTVDDNLQYITIPLTEEAREAIKHVLGETDERSL